ncbi:MAG: V-type ATPase 116kDa subunit family protein [Bacilli bacterium]|nr:V-type ATPase 116kDa subunit family protein [Bacilli bacterium]
MSIAKTKLVNLTADLDCLDQVLMHFIDIKDFHPVLANKIIDQVHGLTSFSADNPCSLILQEIYEIEKEYGVHFPATEIRSLNYNLESMRSVVTETHAIIQSNIKEIKDTEDKIRKYEDALGQVRNIESLKISLDSLFSCQYTVARVGRIPTDSIEKLRYYRNRPFLIQTFSIDKGYTTCIYITTNEYEREVDNIFSSLFFERIFIPDFVHGTPEKAKENLLQEIKLAKEKIAENVQELQIVTKDETHRIANIKGELLFLDKLYESKKYVVGMGDRFTISGFIEEANLSNIDEQFKGNEGLDIEIRPADSDKRITPPTKLKNGWFSKPFGMFVEMYGLPKYGEVDPTLFVAITYSLLFGIMFGDLGQGLLLILIGWIFWKWKKLRLGAIGMRIGIFSAFFGLLYGSFFGDEEILTPFYTEVLGLASKPIHVMDGNFTMTLLIAAIAIGALIILSSILLGIFINIKRKNYAEALLSHNGLSGFLFYAFVLVGAALSLTGIANIINPITIAIFAIVPILMIFLKEPIERKLHHHKMFPNGFGGFFVEGFFELFEVILSYITNTMSFLRVGGFVLSHAGMMLVVFSLKGMAAGAGSILVLVLGNLFVMGLEGLIVGIQVLRLEFYEMFSRYYQADGIAFEALN